MTTNDPHEGPPPENGEELAELLADYVDRISAGESIDRQRILADHPDLGPVLLNRLATFEELAPDVEVEPVVGTLGDYELRRELGRGGMGIVYDAWQASMDRRVALKILPVGIAADTKAVTRFVREARVAGSLRHSGIVPVYGMGVEEKTPYYAMLTGQSPRRRRPS